MRASWGSSHLFLFAWKQLDARDRHSNTPPSEGMWAPCPAIEETFHLVPLSLSLNHLQLFVFPAYVLSILGPSYVPEVSKDKDADPKEY